MFCRNMKNFLLLLITTTIFPFVSFSQFGSAHPGMEFRAKGTGRTTGHIITLSITNTTKQAFTFEMEGFYIPSDGKHQGYVIPPIPDPTIMIDPGATIQLPLSGYCTDIRKPPVKDGADPLPIDEWIPASEMDEGPKPYEPLDETVFQPVGAHDDTTPVQITSNQAEEIPLDQREIPYYTTTYPGTDILFPYKVDIQENAKPSAPLLFETIELITQSFDSLKKLDLITTPFSFDPDKERKSVIQQTFWLYTSLLEDEPYTKNEFEYQLIEQFETTTGQDIEDMDTTVIQQISTGAEQFWNIFELVGVEAKVISQNQEDDASDVGFQDETIPGVEKRCSCSGCEVVQSAGFILIDDFSSNNNIRAVTNDTITWDQDVRYEPPVVRSDCPAHCPTSTITRYERKWMRKNHQDETNTWTEGPFRMGAFSGPSVMEFKAFIELYCERMLCCRDTFIDTLYVIETNDCCDQIRAAHEGMLTFPFGGGQSITFNGQALLLEKNGQTIQYDFPYNIEAMFCNLENGEIFSDIKTTSASSLSAGNGGLNENMESSSLSMERANEADLQAQGVEPHTTFSFMQNIDGEETAFSFSMDKATCKFDIQVLHEGELVEFTSGSIYTWQQLRDQISALSAIPRSQYWWNRMSFLYLQMLKMENESSKAIIQRLIHNKLLEAISGLLNDDTPGGWNLLTETEENLLLELRDAINQNDLNRIMNLLNSGNLPS